MAGQRAFTGRHATVLRPRVAVFPNPAGEPGAEPHLHAADDDRRIRPLHERSRRSRPERPRRGRLQHRLRPQRVRPGPDRLSRHHVRPRSAEPHRHDRRVRQQVRRRRGGEPGGRHARAALHVQWHRCPALGRADRRHRQGARQVPDVGRRDVERREGTAHTCNGTGAQAWQPRRTAARNPQSTSADVTDWSTADGTRLQIWNCWPSANQVWRMRPDTSGCPVAARCSQDSHRGTAWRLRFRRIREAGRSPAALRLPEPHRSTMESQVRKKMLSVLTGLSPSPTSPNTRR